MASIIGHLAVLPLYWLFPAPFSLAGLLIGALLPDLDGIAPVFRQLRDSLRKSRRPEELLLSAWYDSSMRSLHNLVGVMFLWPVGVLLALLTEPSSSLALVAPSVLAGLLSHLILDIPSHPTIRYLTPWERPRAAPVVPFRGVTFLKAVYPFLEKERRLGLAPYAKLPFFNYTVLSSLFPLLTVLLTVFMLSAR